MYVCARLWLQTCSQEVRRRTPGIFPGYWFDFFPSTLEWHWAAGLNMSDCSPAVVPGDWNGPFTRLRLLTALRILPRVDLLTFDPTTLHEESSALRFASMRVLAAMRALEVWEGQVVTLTV